MKNPVQAWAQGLLLVSAVIASDALVNRRSIGGLNSMTTCLVSVTVLQTAPYANYGCFCGGGSAGNEPVDGTDRCCQIHDVCYDRALADAVGCSTLELYFLSYAYTKNIDASGKCHVQCKSFEGYPPSATGAKCKAFLCQCDRKLAECLVKERHTFSRKFVGYRYRNENNCK